MRTIIEPFRIKMTEPIKMTTRIETVWENREAICGYRITYQPEFLRHFTCHFEPIL